MTTFRCASATFRTTAAATRACLILVTALIALCASGCGYGCPMDIRKMAVDDIASRLRREDAALKAQMHVAPNRHGSGAIVYVKAESGCRPKFGWIWVNDVTWVAFDAPSQERTPGLQTLSQASAEDLRSMGVTAETAVQALVGDVCRASARE